LKQWRLLCEKPPKGFEKYFKDGGKKPISKETNGKIKPAIEAESKTSEASKTKPNLSASNNSNKNEWSFGMFGSSQGRSRAGGGGSGRPIGGNDGNDQRWLLIGAAGVVALIASFTFFEMNYREIGWKEFVNK